MLFVGFYYHFWSCFDQPTQDPVYIYASLIDEFIETNNLHQLISEPTNIRGNSMSCIDLIMTDQPAYVVETGVRPSLDNHCQHQLRLQ